MEFTSSTGSALGGATAADSVVSMRAARLARLEGTLSASSAQTSVLASMPSESACVEASRACADSLPRPGSRCNDVGSATVGASARIALPTSVCPSGSLAVLSDGALLRITAGLDIVSGAAFNCADRAMRDNTGAALRAIRDGIAHVKQEQRTATAAIEQERAAGRAQQSAEAAVYNEVLALLEPLRNSRFAQAHHGDQVTQLFGLLSEGAAPELMPEQEGAFEAREAEVQSARQMHENALHARVAEGYLRDLLEHHPVPALQETMVPELEISASIHDNATTERSSNTTVPELGTTPFTGEIAVSPEIPSSTTVQEASAAANASSPSASQENSPAVSSETIFSAQASSARDLDLVFVDPSFACIPDAALLRIMALTDLGSGLALNVADKVVREGTEVALRTIAQGVAEAKQVQLATATAIGQERLAARQNQNAEGAAWAAALAILAPHRASIERVGMDNALQLFELLQAGPEAPEQSAEAEAAFEARIEEAATQAGRREAEVRAHVADGEMRLWSCPLAR